MDTRIHGPDLRVWPRLHLEPDCPTSSLEKDAAIVDSICLVDEHFRAAFVLCSVSCWDNPSFHAGEAARVSVK